MKNEFIATLERAARQKWCVRPYCTTCIARDYRSAIAAIPDLQQSLETVDIDDLLSYSSWSDALRTMAYDNHLRLNWNSIFSVWLPFVEGRVEFADHVLYYIVAKFPCSCEVRERWIRACIDLSLTVTSHSLIETLVRVLGARASEYPQLVELARQEASRDTRLMKAMRKTGLLPPCAQITSEEKQRRLAEKASVNIFGAIKRNDVKAIDSLLSKNPDLCVRNSEGMTAMEYACHLGNSGSAAAEMIKSKEAQPGVAHGRGDLGTVV